MSYQPTKDEAFYSVLMIYKMHLYYPYKESEKRILRFFQWLLIRGLTIFNFVGIGAHLTMSLKHRSYSVIIGDLALGLGYISVFVGLLLFSKHHQYWAQFLRNLTDFNKFEKPENYNKMVKRFNLISFVGALYAITGTYLYVRLPIVDHKPCEKINELHGLNEICGLLWLYLFHFGLMALSLEPGYLDFDNLPDTNFTCVGKVIGGYYADLEANCQMFHVCTIGQADEPMDIRFLCLNGTVFDQETRVCERIDEVDCSKSEQFYSLNLELYGNSGPILEESPEISQETDSPSIIIKSTTSTTTTTTTTTKRPSNRPVNTPYYTTARPHIVSTASSKPKVVSTHHFPVNAPDIRFNPEEINISLNPGAPPDIRTKHFLQQSYSDIISQDIVNDHVNSDGGHSIKVHKPERLHASSSTSPKSIYAMDNSNNQKLPQNSENDFGFSEERYQTDLPYQRQQQFLIQTNSFRHSQSFPPNIDHNSHQYHHQHFHSTTAKQDNNFHQDLADTTLRTIYLHSLKPPEIHQHHHYTHHHRTEKPPHRVQIPIPLLPTLPPLTFSSPAPFTLQRHIETKRYTKDHPSPPRIIISASASVSDASGRRLNYSLGTIGAAQILKAPPASYDDYKDSDVGLDPFYHDVPKLNQKRRKRRSTEGKEEKVNPFDIIKDEKEAVEVLKFLFTWYQSHQATATVPSVTSPVTPDLIHKINYEFAPQDTDTTLLTDSSEYHVTSSKESTSTESLKPVYKNSELFKKDGRYSIVGGYRNLNSTPKLSDKTLKTLANSLLGKYADKTGKNLEVDDILSGLDHNMPKIEEKMDDSEVTFVKDLKEAYFNPYDYVDDNYEGVVYKENNPNNTNEEEKKAVYIYSPTDEKEDIQKIRNGEQTKNFSVNPTTVAELYKYFKVDRDPSTERSTTNIITEKLPNSDTAVTEYHKLENIYNDSNEKFKPKETIDNHTSSMVENLNESIKFTEISILSDLNADSENLEDFSTISTTSTEKSTGRSGNRRGRGKQRQHIENYKERQKDIVTLSGPTEHELVPKVKTKNNINEVISTTRPQNRRGRNRGRSRFVDYQSSTSTTTIKPTAENIIVKEKDSPTTIDIPISTSSTLIETTEPDATLQFFSTVQVLKNHNFNTYSTSKSNVVENYDIYKTNISTETSDILPVSEIPEAISTLDHILDTDRDSLNISSYDNNKYTNEDEIHNIPHENKKGNHEKNVPTEKIKLDYKTTIVNNNHIQIDISTISPVHEKKDHFTKVDELINTNIYDKIIEEDESTTSSVNINKDFDLSGKTTDTQELLSELKPTVETTEYDSGYLIKLLRYFAETAITTEEQPTTETAAESYLPLTESQITTTSTEKAFVPVYSQEQKKTSDSYLKRGRQRGNNRHPPRVSSTTGLPTLKDIYTFSDRSKNEENEIKHNDFNVATSLENLLNSKKIKKNEAEQIILTTPANIDFPITKTILKIPDQELEEHVTSKTELLEKSTVIKPNLPEKPEINPVTDEPLVDTTVTTPYISFEQPEIFGTTILSVTDPTKSHSAQKNLTQMFEISTESSLVSRSEPTKNYNAFYGFYDDVFVVPEIIEKNLYRSNDEDIKTENENNETTAFLESSLSSTIPDSELPSSTEVAGITETTETTSFYTETDKEEPQTPPIIKLENNIMESMGNRDVLYNLDVSTLQPDVEIQKSISLPVSILESTFDVSHDIHNAQDINNLLPSLPISESSTTLRTTEKMQEYIQEIEEFTKSIVAKDDQVKLGFTETYGITATETVPTTLVTVETTQMLEEATTLKSNEEHEKNPKYSLVSEVQHNATEIIFLKDTLITTNKDSTTSLPYSTPIKSSGMVNSSHLNEVVVERTTPVSVSTFSSTTKIPYHSRRTRPPKRRPYNNHNNQNGRHRFSTELFTNKPSKHSEAQYKQNVFSSKIQSENITNAPLHRSATPTRSELKKVSLHTTPLSSKNSHFPSKVSKNYVFNCFGKDKHKYYADPRDCRLFHYCTQGYSKNQLLDLKFVCDQKTFFDDEKLLCTKVKPTRCL